MPYDIALKEGFEQVPDLYDRARPRYPAALFDALEAEAGLKPGARLLEIGPGPGIATVPLAERGYDITAVELSSAMAEMARSRLAIYPKTHVITGAFEEVDLPENAFDLVFSATAMHWIEPAERFAKPHRLLKPAGRLAIIHTNYLSDGRGDKFYKASQPIYESYGLGDTHLNQANHTAELQDDLPQSADIQPFKVDPELFEQIYFKVFPTIKPFSAQEYADVLGTFSTNLALPDNDRQKFLGEMKRLIDAKFGGMISLRYGMSLTIARKLA